VKANVAFFDGIRELIAGARTTVARAASARDASPPSVQKTQRNAAASAGRSPSCACGRASIWRSSGSARRVLFCCK